MRRGGADLLVLCYHAVSETWPAELSVTPGALETQHSLLVRSGYRGTTFAQAVSQPPKGATLVVTFDDAFESVYRLARSTLARLDLPASVFVPTRQALRDAPMAWPGVDSWLGGPHEHELRGMSASQLRELANDGWEIGAHTRTHPRLTDLDEHELGAELSGSREDCESQLSVPCRTLAYPFGAADRRVRAAARAAGFEAAAGLSRDLSGASLFYWPRVGIYHGDDERRFRRKVSRPVRRLWATPAVARVLGRRPGEPSDPGAFL